MSFTWSRFEGAHVLRGPTLRVRGRVWHERSKWVAAAYGPGTTYFDSAERKTLHEAKAWVEGRVIPTHDPVDDEDMLPCDYEDDRDARRPARPVQKVRS